LRLERQCRSTRILAEKLERDARVTLRIVGNSEARALNRDYRGRNYPTNVLTFVMQRKPRLEGDLALCAPVIRREARSRRRSAAAHYAHLVVHGVLHLQGYDHDTASGARTMEAREAAILAAVGVADPYAAPAPARR